MLGGGSGDIAERSKKQRIMVGGGHGRQRQSRGEWKGAGEHSRWTNAKEEGEVTGGQRQALEEKQQQ